MPFCEITDCPNYTEGNTKLCPKHNFEKRKAAKQALKPKKEFKRLKQVSTKEAARLKQYKPLRDEHLEKHPMCQIKIIGCTGKATSCHHSEKRGKNLLKVESFMSACDWCHHQVEFVLSAVDRRKAGLLK